VRRICRDFRRAVPASAELVARFELERFCTNGSLILYEPGGCPSCRGTGYSGRLAIAELLAPDETTHRLILARAGHAEIHSAACASGMQTMYENGLRQVVNGTTSLSEILRSIRLEG
jgi:general secretion pathway protein E